MRYLNEETARELLDLNPGKTIPDEIAERQFRVILEGFNHLQSDKPCNDFLYIADEVGLGKTYIALGITALLRYYSDHPESYHDLVLVPKKNLQYKWDKEIRRFVKYNWRKDSNRVSSILSDPIGNIHIHRQLEGIDPSGPTYDLFRNSSFSLAFQQETEEKWVNALAGRLSAGNRNAFLDYASRLGLREVEKIRHLFAYFLNMELPDIDLLIVDEGHNYKHGIGMQVSNRNRVVSRLVGHWQDEWDFPDLQRRVRRKVGKVIFLSATPIDRGVLEIRNQLDCFFPQHPFQGDTDPEEAVNRIKDALPDFLIRGVMQLNLTDSHTVTRNMYRFEHRNGNVSKEDRSSLRITDDLQSMILGLIQYRTLRELTDHFGARFEIGMLAGFETFAASIPQDREYEETATRDQKKSADQSVIREIADSYRKAFREELPHPKQGLLIAELEEYLINGKKALVFVRRIASATELEQKLLTSFEKMQIGKIRGLRARDNARIKQMLDQWKLHLDRRQLDSTLELLADRLVQQHSRELNIPDKLRSDDLDEVGWESFIVDHLHDLFIVGNDLGEAAFSEFRQLTEKHLYRTRLEKRFKQLAIDLLNRKWELTVNGKLESGDASEGDTSYSNYFFDVYFARGKGDGSRFRKRSYDYAWYELNYFLLSEAFAILRSPYNAGDLAEAPELTENERKREITRFQKANDIVLWAMERGGDHTPGKVDEFYTVNTFMTRLITGPCRSEFEQWLQQHAGGKEIWQEIGYLNEILKSIFRNGSGRLPAYLADCLSEKETFEEKLLEILSTTFPLVLKELKTIIRDYDQIMRLNFPDPENIEKALYQQTPVVGLSGAHHRDVSRTATHFRMPGFPYLLIATDIIKEGEDLHPYCKDIFHYGIAWNPSDMEQRTGRIDRIGSYCYQHIKGKDDIGYYDHLHVFFPYLSDTLERNQVQKVFTDMNSFVDTFYDFTNPPQVDHATDIDRIVEGIPEPIKIKLSSKYDIDRFRKVEPSPNSVTLTIRPHLGMEAAALKTKFQRLIDAIRVDCKDISAIHRDREVNGVLNIGGRRGPFRIRLENGHDPGTFTLHVKSMICRQADLIRSSHRGEIEEVVRNAGFEFHYQQQMLIIGKRFNFSLPVPNLRKAIFATCAKADEMEHRYTGGMDGTDEYDPGSQ